MKKFTTLFVLLIFAFSIFTTNVGAFNIDTEFDTNDLTNQWEFVYEELSEIQEEPNVVNGFSMVDVNRSYGGSTLAEANMVNYDLSTKSISYENFNMNSYENRNAGASAVNTTFGSSNIDLDATNSNECEMSGSYIPEDMEFAISTSSVFGSDERTPVSQTKNWPYRGIVKIRMTFNHVLKQSDGNYYDRTYSGTGFMLGPNLLVTAGHCAYDDVTTTTSSGNTDYEDYIDNPRFPDVVRVYAGVDGSDVADSTYIYYAEVSVINIQKEYFQTTHTNYDWCAMQLDRDLGVQTGYYGKISNWYEAGASVYSYGYPGDKPNNTMWETHGNLTGNTSYQYCYNFDTYNGQSGSPVFMTADDGSVYVCGIHTSGSPSAGTNYATRINSFIYHYLNSFVSYNNYEHLAATIVPTDYGFADAYPTDNYTKTNYITHTLSSGFQFQTRRYRTGYIHNEYIVMSPFRSGITEAFIEYKFDAPVSKIEVDLSHWRSLAQEWTYSSNCTAVLRVPDGQGGYTVIFDLLAESTNLPTDRTNPTTYTIEFPTPVYSFEFYMHSDRINTNDNNRGRICIGNINVYTKEGWY